VLVAGPAQGRIHLGFQRGLDDQPGPQVGVLDNLAQLTVLLPINQTTHKARAQRLRRGGRIPKGKCFHPYVACKMDS